MNRGHSTKEIIAVVQKAKTVRPYTAITCDLIVGFPGETEAHFQESVTLVQQLELAKLHVFPFSPRQGTMAAKMKNQISNTIKKERAEKFRNIGGKLRNDFYKKNYGVVQEVLFENHESGLTTNFIRVKKEGAEENDLKRILLSESNIVV